MGYELRWAPGDAKSAQGCDLVLRGEAAVVPGVMRRAGSSF